VPNIKAIVTACDLNNCLWGALFSWEGILSSKSAIDKVDRFSTASFRAEMRLPWQDSNTLAMILL